MYLYKAIFPLIFFINRQFFISKEKIPYLPIFLRKTIYENKF